MIDLDVGADRVTWIEREYGRIAAMPRRGESMTEVRAPNSKPEYVRHMAFSGDRVVWVVEDGGVWVLAPDGTRSSIGNVPRPTALEAHGDLVVVASHDGIFGLTQAGDVRRLYPKYAWMMAIDSDAAYAQLNTISGKPNSALMRIPLDGTEPTMIAPEELGVLSVLSHRGRVLYTTHHGVFEAVGGATRPIVELEGMDLIQNLRAAGERVYFTRGNVIYQLRDKQALPVAISTDTINDLEIDGRTFYAVMSGRGVRVHCIDPDAPPVALVPPDPAKRTCLAGEKSQVTQFGATECRDATGETKYSISFHISGAVSSEYGRNGVARSWYADGTLRDEWPIRGAGAEKHFYANGKLREDGERDANGDKHGRWKTYGSDGAERTNVEWAHGKRK